MGELQSLMTCVYNMKRLVDDTTRIRRYGQSPRNRGLLTKIREAREQVPIGKTRPHTPEPIAK